MSLCNVKARWKSSGTNFRPLTPREDGENLCAVEGGPDSFWGNDFVNRDMFEKVQRSREEWSVVSRSKFNSDRSMSMNHSEANTDTSV